LIVININCIFYSFKQVLSENIASQQIFVEAFFIFSFSVFLFLNKKKINDKYQILFQEPRRASFTIVFITMPLSH
jgi:predicted PurR-regulated permease PerM